MTHVRHQPVLAPPLCGQVDLSGKGIPFRLVGGKEYYAREEAQALFDKTDRRPASALVVRALE